FIIPLMSPFSPLGSPVLEQRNAYGSPSFTVRFLPVARTIATRLQESADAHKPSKLRVFHGNWRGHHRLAHGGGVFVSRGGSRQLLRLSGGQSVPLLAGVEPSATERSRGRRPCGHAGLFLAEFATLVAAAEAGFR